MPPSTPTIHKGRLIIYEFKRHYSTNPTFPWRERETPRQNNRLLPDFRKEYKSLKQNVQSKLSGS